MGLDTIVEGIETQEHARIVNQTGANMMQGYYFGRPAVGSFNWNKTTIAPVLSQCATIAGQGTSVTLS